MKIFADKEVKGLFTGIAFCVASYALTVSIVMWKLRERSGVWLSLLAMASGCAILLLCVRHFWRRYAVLESAIETIDLWLSGDTGRRIDCDYEGQLNRLFHSVNTLAAVLSAHTEKEAYSKAFLKDTVSDISHQLKTPLAALNIYNGIMQHEAESLDEAKEFAALSEQELDRIGTLVQNLLKITRLDAGTIVIEKAPENIYDMMQETASRFSYRLKPERKELSVFGDREIVLMCDRSWLLEAVGNLVKNAFDHTASGGHIEITFGRRSGLTQISVKDDGSGIPAEDIHHIFKRFYRSRFAKDTQGLGLGLPLAKAIVELHGGSLTVDSFPGCGSTFVMSFANTTKL